jgi:hypothetical protein
MAVVARLVAVTAGDRARFVVEARMDRGWWLLEFPALQRLLGQVRDLMSARLIAAEAIMIAMGDETGHEPFVAADDIELVVHPATA